MRHDFAQKNPNTVLTVLAATLAAEQHIFTQTEKAIDGYLEWTQAKDRAAAAIDINAYLPLANRNLRFAPDGFMI